MPLPMDNIIFRLILQLWPVFLAVAATLIVVYQWLRPKLTAEKLQRGLIRQGVLNVVGEMQDGEDDPDPPEWIEARKKMKSYLRKAPSPAKRKNQPINYRDNVTVSLVWTLFWIGTFAFVVIRILLSPHYYGGEAAYLGYFAYYIVLGLVVFFKRK